MSCTMKSGKNMYMLSDGETLYLIHDGKTRVYKNPRLKQVDEMISGQEMPVYHGMEMEYMNRGRQYIDIDMSFVCDEAELINEELTFNITSEKDEFDEDDYLEELSIREILNIFNEKVNKRREEGDVL